MLVPLTFESEKRIVKAECPVSWEDVSLKMFYEILDWRESKDQDIIKLYAILTDTDYDIIKKCTNFSVVNTLDQLISFVWTDSGYPTSKLPKTVSWKGDQVLIPKELDLKEIGQLIAVESQFKKIISSDITQWEKELKTTAFAVACLMYQEFTGEEYFDDKKVMDLVKEIEELPASEMVPLGFFFIRKYQRLRGVKVSGLPPMLRRSKRKLKWKTFLRLVALRLLMLWRGVISRNSKKLSVSQ